MYSGYLDTCLRQEQHLRVLHPNAPECVEDSTEHTTDQDGNVHARPALNVLIRMKDLRAICHSFAPVNDTWMAQIWLGHIVITLKIEIVLTLSAWAGAPRARL